MSGTTVVPSGVVRLVELQEGGYAYVRPQASRAAKKGRAGVARPVAFRA